eukprot:1161568-Pelagomonas_calceolata.AAC.7
MCVCMYEHRVASSITALCVMHARGWWSMLAPRIIQLLVYMKMHVLALVHANEHASARGLRMQMNVHAL